MRELTELTIKATEGISGSYFNLNIDGGDSVYRERVYCYELYHQLRLRWPESKYYLNGEVDKAAHLILEKLGANRVKPDLLVHKPGYMEGNHAIIEVKSEKAQRIGIKKDIESLSLFINKVNYKRAIYLLFGYELNDSKFQEIIEVSARIENLVPIEVWFHVCHDSPAYKFGMIG